MSAAAGRGTHLRWAVLLAAGAALRLWVIARATLIETDGAFYAQHAMELGRGRPDLFLSAAWPPLYPAAIALFAWALAPLSHALAPERFELAGRLVSCAAGVLLPLPVFALARRAAGTRVAWLAALLVAFHPRCVEYSAAALTESLFTLLFWTALAAAARGGDADGPGGRRGGFVPAVLAGALAGCAYLVRTEGLLLLACLLAAQWWPRRGRSAAARSAVLLAAAMVFVIPFVAYVHARTGAWSVGEKSAYNFWRAFAGTYDAQYGRPDWLVRRMTDGPEIAALAPGGAMHALAFAAGHAGLVATLWARQLAENVVSSFPAAAYYPYVALALLGIGRVRRRPLAGGLLALLVLTCAYSLFTRDRRFFVPFVPLVLVWTAAGLPRLADAVARALRSAPGPRALRVAAAIACLAGAAYTASVTLREPGAPEQRRAAAWLRAHAARGARFGRPVVMARKPFVAYYADGVIAGLPDLPAASLERLARELGADYVVADGRALGDRPQLRPWMRPGGSPWPVAYREDGPQPVVILDARAPAARP